MMIAAQPACSSSATVRRIVSSLVPPLSASTMKGTSVEREMIRTRSAISVNVANPSRTPRLAATPAPVMKTAGKPCFAAILAVIASMTPGAARTALSLRRFRSNFAGSEDAATSASYRFHRAFRKGVVDELVCIEARRGGRRRLDHVDHARYAVGANDRRFRDCF